jgi:hypothetical protein
MKGGSLCKGYLYVPILIRPRPLHHLDPVALPEREIASALAHKRVLCDHPLFGLCAWDSFGRWWRRRFLLGGGQAVEGEA